MSYFQTKADIAHMNSLLAAFERLVEIERESRGKLREEGTDYLSPLHLFKAIREHAAAGSPEYRQLRASFAQMIPRANDICDREHVSWHREGRAAPMEGGMPFRGSIFDLVLDRPSDFMDIDNDVRDTVNRALGSLERTRGQEVRRLLNPISWVTRAVVFVVRLPYLILQSSGFDVDKIQEHLIARLFQLLYGIALIVLLVRFGLGSVIDLKSLLVP